MRGVCRLLACLALVAIAPASADAAGSGGGGPTDLTPSAPQRVLDPAGRKAEAIADRTRAVKDLRRRARATVLPEIVGGTKWRVGYFVGADRELEVDVDVAGRGSVERIWRGPAATFRLARGYPGWFGAHVTAPWIWLPLCAVFLLLFIDLRRLRRLVHLDLAVLIVGFGVSQWFFQRGRIDLSVPLAYIPLVYLLVRMAMLARSDAGAPRLAPVFGPRTLAVVLVVLCAFRIGLNVLDTNDHYYVGWGKVGSTVIDVGYAGVAGADRIQQGLELYTPTAHLDTYGPLNYVAYVPFERIWPFTGAWDSLPAAHAATIAFDLLTVVGLFVLGLRLLPGRDGRALGLALACAWAACPYTTYALNSNTNDGIVSASVVWAMVAFRSSAATGVALGVGAAAKFVPAALLPAVIRLRRPGGVRAAIVCVGVFVAVIAVAVLAYAPPQGLRLVWEHTIARQNDTASPFSIWVAWDWIEWLRKPLQLLTIVAAGVAAFGNRRSVVQAAAIGAALILAVQVTALHWIYFYILWFLPLVFVALLVPSGAWRDAPTSRS